MSKLVGRVEKRNGQVPHPHVLDLKNGKDVLAVEFIPEQRGVPAPHQAAKPRFPMPRKEVLVTSGCKKTAGTGSEKDKAFGVPGSSC